MLVDALAATDSLTGLALWRRRSRAQRASWNIGSSTHGRARRAQPNPTLVFHAVAGSGVGLDHRGRGADRRPFRLRPVRLRVSAPTDEPTTP